MRGSFDHIFIYGLNPDLVSEPAFSPTASFGGVELYPLPDGNKRVAYLALSSSWRETTSSGRHRGG